MDFICFGSRTFSSWIGRAIVRKEINCQDCANNLKDVFAKLDSLVRELSLPGIEKRKTVAIDKKPDYDLRPRKNGFELSFDIEGAKNKALLSVETIGAHMVTHIQLDEEDSKYLFGNKETLNTDFAVFGEKCLLESALENYRNNRKDEPPFVVMEGLFRSLYLIAMEADKTVAEHIARELWEAGRFKGVDPEDAEVFERFLSMFTASVRMAVIKTKQEKRVETKFKLPPSDKATIKLSEMLFRR